LDEAAQRAREILAEQLDALGERPLTVDEIEELVEQASREAARWLEERLIIEQTPPAANTAPCPQCGHPARYKQTLHTQLLTIHGQQPVAARYHYCAPCQYGFCPQDVLLGIERGRKATRRVRAWMARFAVQEESFAAVPPLLVELRGLEVSESTVERTTVEVGAALAAANQTRAQATSRADGTDAGAPESPAAAPEAEEPRPCPEGARLYLALDGTMCPLRDAWRKDGSLGKLVCRYGEAKVGMAFTTGHKEGLDTGIVTRGCIGTLENITVFTLLMVALARQWGAQRAQEVVVLGDGAAWIWNLARRYFPQAVQIVDLWPVLERLWTVAEVRFGSRSSAAAQGWVRQMRDHLEHNLVGTVIGELERWEPKRKTHRQLRAEQLTFFEGNRQRMQYQSYLARGYLVGSGPIESQCKQLVQRRLHEGGMHWREGPAEAVLAIRACLHSTRRTDLRVYA
jgi:hypothetical protein